jgi:hypothetical protein
MSYEKPKGFLKGLEFRHFMDTYEEWHAFTQGFCEVLCPWPPRHKSMNKELRKQIASEYHYYLFGRAMGVIAWLIIAKIIQEAFF